MATLAVDMRGHMAHGSGHTHVGRPMRRIVAELGYKFGIRALVLVLQIRKTDVCLRAQHVCMFSEDDE